MNNISPKQFKQKLTEHKLIVLDVRSEDKFAHSHLEHNNADVINVPKQQIFALANPDESVDLPFSKETDVIVTCTTGNSARRCAEILTNKGYQVTVLDGGMTAWHEENKE